MLQEFDFAIQHTLGNENALADFLSKLEETHLEQTVMDDLLDVALYTLAHG